MLWCGQRVQILGAQFVQLWSAGAFREPIFRLQKLPRLGLLEICSVRRWQAQDDEDFVLLDEENNPIGPVLEEDESFEFLSFREAEDVSIEFSITMVFRSAWLTEVPFGAIFKGVREAKGLSLSVVASKAGLTEMQLSSYEKATFPSITSLGLVSQAMNVRLSGLFMVYHKLNSNRQQR